MGCELGKVIIEKSWVDIFTEIELLACRSTKNITLNNSTP